ncbi:translation elongation factor EF-1alpha (GTPase) HBS1 isoform X1 [Amblyomma americanum]
MSRHRNVRTMNYDDDYEGYYDVYGRSQEEDSCISPTTEEQFLYNRDKLHSMSSFLSPQVLQEENEEEDDEDEGAQKSGPVEPQLSPVDEVRLYECLEKMQNVVGDSIPEATLRRAALEGDFNAEVALDRLLQEADKPKPQREQRRRESDGDDDCAVSPSVVECDGIGGVGCGGGGGSGAFITVPPYMRTTVVHFDAPTKRQRHDARTSGGKEYSGATGEVVSTRAETNSLAPLRVALPLLPSVCTAESSGCALRRDSLLKLSGVGGRASGSSEGTRHASGCDSEPCPHTNHGCETRSVYLSHSVRGTQNSCPVQEVHKTDCDEEFLDMLLCGGNVENTTKPDSQKCLSVAEEPDELDMLLGMVSSSSPSRPASSAEAEKKSGPATSTDMGDEPLVWKPVTDAVGDSLDALLGVTADPASSQKQGQDSGGMEFDDFLMSLKSDAPGRSSSRAQDDGSTVLPLLDILSGTSDVEKGPKNLPKDSSMKRHQPALLNLGEILGLGQSRTPTPCPESGTLKLDDILKGMGSSPVGSQEDHLYGDNEDSVELSLFQSTAAVVVKEASLFGKVLVFFPFSRRRVTLFGLGEWLKKLDLLEPRVGVKAKTVPFDFSTPSPDDIVLACLKRAVVAPERKPLTPLDQVGLNAKATVKEVLPAVDPALRQSFPKQPSAPEVDEKRDKVASAPLDGLKVPSATSSNRSSPDLERKEPSPEAAGDTPASTAEGITPKTPRTKSSSKDAAAEYAKERGTTKALLNLVVIGHVDAGKSTLMGHLLYRLGCVQKKQMHKYEQESKKLGKASFMYAWVLDETSEERNRGITMDVAQAKFETPNRSIVLLDAPGHRDFIPNMITGAAQADVAILVVDATRGEFETGFETGGQTREHTLLVRSLGVSQLAVAINKLDNVSWDEGRYNEITAKLRSFLRQAGYRESDFTFVPCSGLTGENLTTKPAPDSPLTKWYNGPCLVDVIDGFKPPERPISKPFRLCVSDVFKGTGSGFCVSGRIDAGCVAIGDKILVMPAAEQGSVKGITIDEVPVPQAFAGDQVALTLSGVDMIKVTTGSFVCDPAVPIRVSTRFQARLVVFNIEVPLTRGFPVVLHYQSTTEQASIHRIISQLNKGTGEVMRNKPRCLVKNTSGLVEIKVCRPMCVELYKEFKELGRITLRSGGSTVAAGVITEVL